MKVTRALLPAVLTFATASTLFADALKCDVAQYKASPGLTATLDQDLLVISWTGQGGAELRARYAVEGGRPIVRDLAVRKAGGPWSTLGQNLTAEYRVTSGIRRLSEQQAQPLRFPS